MASGHVNRIQKAEHMAAPTNAANVQKVLVNSEPSTHGTFLPCANRAEQCRLSRVDRPTYAHREVFAF